MKKIRRYKQLYWETKIKGKFSKGFLNNLNENEGDRLWQQVIDEIVYNNFVLGNVVVSISGQVGMLHKEIDRWVWRIMWEVFGQGVDGKTFQSSRYSYDSQEEAMSDMNKEYKRIRSKFRLK